MDKGPTGVYRTFAINGVPAGAVTTKLPEEPSPYWRLYINVDALDHAVSRVEQGGGRAIADPHPVAGESWIVLCTDPQGAIFAMLAPRRCAGSRPSKIAMIVGPGT